MNRRAARATRRQTDAAKAAPSPPRSGAPFTGQPHRVALRSHTIFDALALRSPFSERSERRGRLSSLAPPIELPRESVRSPCGCYDALMRARARRSGRSRGVGFAVVCALGAGCDVPRSDAPGDVVAQDAPAEDAPPTDDVPPPEDAVSEDLPPPDDAQAPMDVVASRDVVPAMDVVAPRDVVTVTDVVAPRDVVAVTDAVAPRDVVVPQDVPRDAGPPPLPPCRAGTGGATVAAPVRLRSFRDTGQESWQGSVAVADLDRDGANEVIATRGARVVVWRRDGSVFWARAPGTARVWAGALVGDFAGDAQLEVVAAAGARVALYDARGTLAAGFPATWRDEVRALAGGDLDGDGRPEIVAGTTMTAGSGAREDVITAFRANGSAVAGYPPNGTGTSRCDSACDIAGAFDQNIAIGRIDGDASSDILVGTDNAYASWHRGSGEAFPVAGIFRGVTRSPGVRFMVSYAEAQQGYSDTESTSEQAHFTNTGPVIADIDGDGARELVMVSSVQNVAQTDRRRGVALWVIRPDGTRPPAWVTPFRVPAYLGGLSDLGGNVVAATNQVAVADIDTGASGQEMVFAGFDGRIHCVAADRTERWSYPFTTAANVLTGGVALADLSNDGRPEVVFTTYSTQQNAGALFVLDARGALLHRVALPGRGAMPVPTVADLDGDGTLEILVSLKDAASDGAEVIAFNVPGSGALCLPWPTGRGNLLRNGSR